MFNKGKLLLGILLSVIFFIIAHFSSGMLHLWFTVLGILILLNITLAIIASYLFYDRSILYKPKKLFFDLKFNSDTKAILLHASFDPISPELEQIITPNNLSVYNIYGNRHEHDKAIEISNQIFPPSKREIMINPSNLPDKSESVDFILAITSLHEIMSQENRVAFFKEAKRVLKPDGKLIIVEQLRNKMNFLFFNIGAFHFASLTNWEKGISEGGLKIVKRGNITHWGTILHVTK